MIEFHWATYFIREYEKIYLHTPQPGIVLTSQSDMVEYDK